MIQKVNKHEKRRAARRLCGVLIAHSNQQHRPGSGGAFVPDYQAVF
ncbi:MAG TPA: hypothetical protein GXZ86_07965 [Clostridiales bacterium]|nr:hypothetical protein [Clostridiales bacterium]